MATNPELDAVEAYLGRERRVLLSGRIAELDSLSEDRAGMLSVLATAKGSGQRLQRLLSLAHRNSELMHASAAGIRSAIVRLREFQKAAGPIGSYSSNGARCEIGSITPKFERKA